MDAFAMDFTEGDLGRARGAALRLADEHGLRGERAADLVIVVNEAVANVLIHGGGRGRLRLWREGVSLLCEVRDSGPGLPSRYLAKTDPPAPATRGHWGIWMMRRLADRVAITTGPHGTAIRMAIKIS
ncbi:ATP-binding protein [Nonomuraea sp. NPDC049269]|uniref:ATP-binding protein n=1 Tax=Nonomuraea sp. NPDC049269 TaxID=3364349 RepID=UPI00370FD207